MEFKSNHKGNHIMKLTETPDIRLQAHNIYNDTVTSYKNIFTSNKYICKSYKEICKSYNNVCIIYI